MANSYTEYTASSVSTSTQFATPSYITGRGATDISVAVGGVTQASSAYTLTGTNITFASSSLPTDGAKIRITRSTSQNARINTYSENTILTSSQLNTDGDQSFMMSQEALDQAASTDFGAQTFYTSGTSAPSSATAGDLFFNTTTGLLQIYTGSAFESVNNRGTKQTFAISGSTTVFTPSTPVDDNTLVFLNGVLLVKGSGSAGDYTSSSTQVTLNTAVSSGVVEVVTFPNSTNGTFTSGINVTGNVGADGFKLYRDDGVTESLDIFTDSSNDTFIQERDADNGSLKILGTALQLRSDDLRLMNRAGTETYFEGDVNGAAKLFYDSSAHGTAKLETTATGINVTGTVTADGLSLGDGEFSLLNGNLKIQSISNNSFIDHIDTNSSKLFVRAEGATHIKSLTANKLQASFEDSEVSLWHDNSKVLATENGGINVTGTVTADGLTLGDNQAATFNGNLEIKSNGNDSSITESDANGSLTIKGQNLYLKNGSNQALFTGASGVQLYNNGERRFQTVPAGIAVEGTDSVGGQLTLREADYENAGEHKVTFKPASANWAGNYDITVPVTGNGSMVVADSSGNVNVNGTVTATGIALNGNMETDGNITIQNGHELKFEALDGSESLSIGTNANNGTTIHEQAIGGNLNIKGDALVLFGNNRDLAKITVHDEGGVKINSELGTDTTVSYARIKVGNQHTGTRFYCGTDESTVRAEVVSAGLNVNGDIEVTDNTKGVILKSPNGSRFRLEVANDGTLSTEAL